MASVRTFVGPDVPDGYPSYRRVLLGPVVPSIASRIDPSSRRAWLRNRSLRVRRRDRGRGPPERRARPCHLRAGAGAARSAGVPACRRPLPAARRAGTREDAPDQDARRRGQPEVQPHSVHAGSDAVRHPRHGRDGGRHRDRPAADPVHRRADFREHHPGRRDQPHAPAHAGRAARGDAGVSGHGRRHPVSARAAAVRARHRKPDRTGRARIRCPKPSSIASCSTW